MTIDASDERAHAPAAVPWWWEAWHLDAANDNGIGLTVRLACAPALGVAWWWTHLLLPDLAGPVVVRDHEVGLPRRGLVVRADGLWGELWCETPLEHWTYGLEAFGVRLDDPADSLRGEVGERMPVGLDLEWEADPGAALREYAPGAARSGYEQFGTVHGEVLLGRSRFELDAVGLRSHEWGVPRFGRPARSVWLRAPGLDASFTAFDDVDVDGAIARGAGTQRVSAVRSETRRAGGLPVAARHVVDDGIEIDAEVLGLVTVPLAGPAGERAVLARGLCRYEIADPAGAAAGIRRRGAGGQAIGAGVGWSTWLDPE